MVYSYLMDRKTLGAWLIHHTKKLGQFVPIPGAYDQIELAGKSGLLLNSLAASEEVTMSNERVENLASAVGIRPRLDLPTILTELERQRLIDRSTSGISVLGLTTSQTLEYTSVIFEESNPKPSESAALDLAELSSEQPVSAAEVRDQLSDTHRISSNETTRLLDQYSEIGFVDVEKMRGQSIYFNGNLFRKEDARKINGVLAALSTSQEASVKELIDLLKRQGCLDEESAEKIVGKDLLFKLVSVGFVDINVIGNSLGRHNFVTVPSAFNKYSNSGIDDAFDLAKAFVTSITYGMTASESRRGKITMVEKLMRRLIEGLWVGPATAIGQDYKVLELKGVIVTRPYGDDRFYMRLLKRDIGEIALKVITEGEASSDSLLRLPAASATQYLEPEVNRVMVRRQQGKSTERNIEDLLDAIRKGGLQ
jgi:hypothetical protein